jgi:hypothetical protein
MACPVSRNAGSPLAGASSAEASSRIAHFFHVHQKINVTAYWGLAGRYRDQGVIVPLDALSPRAENSIPRHLKGSSIAICRRPQIVNSGNSCRQCLHFLRGFGLLQTLVAEIV